MLLFNVDKVIKCNLFLFCVASLLIPAHAINKLLYISIIVLFIFKTILTGSSIARVIAPVIILAIFLYGFFLSLLTGSYDSGIARQLLLSTSILFLIYIISNTRVNFDKVLFCAGVSILIITYLLYIYSSSNITVVNDVYLAIRKYGLVAEGDRKSVV